MQQPISSQQAPKTKPTKTMIRLKLDVKKIDKALLFTGAKGTYCDITLMDNRDGTDQYGNDGFAVQDVGKERRMAGEKGPIIGNWQHVNTGSRPVQKSMPSAPSTVHELVEDDEIPF
jgi:hypothetical protein